MRLTSVCVAIATCAPVQWLANWNDRVNLALMLEAVTGETLAAVDVLPWDTRPLSTLEIESSATPPTSNPTDLQSPGLPARLVNPSVSAFDPVSVSLDMHASKFDTQGVRL